MKPNQNLMSNYMVSDRINWELKPEQVIAIVFTLGVLVAVYINVVYYASKNSYDFLYKQSKFKNHLLTAFYTMAMATCICRIA